MQFKIQKVIIVFFIGAMLFLNGCIAPVETSRKIMGTSVKALEDARPGGKSQIIQLDYPACYNKVIAILRKMNAHIFLHNPQKKRIVAMNFKDQNNTTEVAIFFTQVTPHSTRVEISCLSHPVLENVSDKIFSALKDNSL